jgi:hypothetical protein
MRSFHARGVWLALGLVCLAQGVGTPVGAQQLEQPGEPSLLPIPAALPLAYPVAQTTAIDSNWYSQPVVPAPDPDSTASPSDAVITPEYQGAMSGSWGGSGACNDVTACSNKYIYASGLVMTFDKRGGFVTSIDSGTGTPEIFFCDPEFGRIWHGGFEIGGGWCFGCNCQNAIEASYWGLYAAPGSVYATGPVDSMIDFTNVDYGGGSADGYFDGSVAHRLLFDRNFHSVEVNLLGNGCNGGPFGCGACGCCTPYGCGNRIGFGWLAGLRFLHYSEDWQLTADNGDGIFDGGADEASYNVDLSNNLIGFQMGAGLNFCVTQRLSAYTITKFGAFGNAYSHEQSIGGSSGGGTLNTGDFSGQVYGINDDGFDIAFAGQIDTGARWNMTDRWSLNFGYRLVALSGIAIAEDNVAQGNFQNVLGISDTQKTGSMIMHGGYIGAEFCW